MMQPQLPISGKKKIEKKLINAITFSYNINGLMLFVHTGIEGEK